MPPFLKVSGYIAGIAAKGGCYLCGASKRSETEVVVDTGVTIDFEGRILVCEACVREMGHLVGMVDGAEVDELRDEVVGARAAQHSAEAHAAEKVRLATDALAHAAEQSQADEVAVERTRAAELDRALGEIEDEVLELGAQRDEALKRAAHAEASVSDLSDTVSQQEAALAEANSQQDGEVTRDAGTGRFVTDDEADDDPEGTVHEKVRRKSRAKAKESVSPPKPEPKTKETS